MKNQSDVVIVGAGPAGSSAAALLAEQGHSVTLFERDRFPRYKVGESLIPFTYYPLERLGLIERMRRSHFVKKYSVQFVSPSGKASQPFYFSTRYDENVAQTWQVLRSEFDQILLDNALEKGASVREACEVEGFIRSSGRVAGVRVRGPDGMTEDHGARLVIDASGKEALAVRKNHWRERDPFFNKIAVWTYYEGALRDEGIDAGATTVAFIPEKGWFWYIPQHENRTSVGVVADGKYLSRDGLKRPKEMFEREIGENKWIEDHLKSGKQVGPHYVTSEYTFRSRYCAEDGLLLVGDAFGFLDSVFSSGLLLALKSGVSAADHVHAALVEGDSSAERFAEYGRELREGIENMRKLVYAFYDPSFSFRQLTEKYPDLAGDLTDCLSGDVNKDFSLLWKHVSEFVTLPEELPFGRPMANDSVRVPVRS